MSEPLKDEVSPAVAEPSWVPDAKRVENALLTRFMQDVSRNTGRSFTGYDDLHAWSVAEPEAFWSQVWDFCGVIGDKGDRLFAPGKTMRESRFFPDAKLNYAENLLRRRDDEAAMIFRNEKGAERTLSFKDVYERVSLWQQALEASGVGEGDRVAGYIPNMPEAIIAMLAASSLGAIWSSASPDFGVQGVLDRFGQVEPKIFISVDGYYYNGKVIDCLGKIREIQPHLPGLEKTVIVPFVSEHPQIDELSGTVVEQDFLGSFEAGDIAFKRLPFDHPLFIMFSSGTTGAPKCIAHGQGGTLIQHMKEHQLQSDIKPGDRVFYFSTCGWMMWNWLASVLASEATVLLYDGSPFYPDGNVLWGYTSAHNCTLFGTSAKYIDALKVHGLRPAQGRDLASLRTLCSTGSPLVHESFDYIYENIKEDIHISSISGGTDIVSCFVLGNPISPVWRGEIQGAGLGMAVEVFGDDGAPIPPGAGSGELVCTKPFPCMPIGFWNDPDGSKYKNAYFAENDQVWMHGDWIEKTVHGGFIIHGRSDATLNPGGVRIGTAEIYRQVEKINAVAESIAVGQNWDNDVRVILFVVLKEGETLDDELKNKIKAAIRSGASPRHVPAVIIQVADIPRTRSGKISEIAVRHIIHGRDVKNKEALANPEALELYKNLAALQA